MFHLKLTSQITSPGWSVAAEHGEHTVTLWNTLKICCSTHKQTHTEHSAWCVCVYVCWGRAKESRMKRAVYAGRLGDARQPITQSVCRPCIQSTLCCGDTSTTHLHIIYINIHIHWLYVCMSTSWTSPSLCGSLSRCDRALAEVWAEGLLRNTYHTVVKMKWNFPKFLEMPTKKYELCALSVLYYRI